MSELTTRAKIKRNCDWFEYFGDRPKIDKIQNGSALYVTSESSNYHISNCFFFNCKENGAIYFDDYEPCVLVELSIFSNCKSTYSGGSIYYFCSNGQFVQQQNCFYKSISQINDMSFYQETKYYEPDKNYVFQVSVYLCGQSEYKGYSTFCLEYGDIQFENNDITNNKCGMCSSYGSTLNGAPVTCNFSTFRENNQTGSESLSFAASSTSLTQNVSYCNVIGNRCGTDNEQVLFICGCTTNVERCIFLNNTAVYMFEQYYKRYTLTISETYVESNSTIGSVSFNRLTKDHNFNNLHHFYTENCFIEAKTRNSSEHFNVFKRSIHRRR